MKTPIPAFRALFVALLVCGAPFALGQTDPGVYPSERESARAWFNSNWAKTLTAIDSTGDVSAQLKTAMGYTGNIETGAPGDLSAAWRDKALLRLNIFRRMAGQTGVGAFETKRNTQAQLAAMISAANNDIAGYPPIWWKFYTVEAGNACGNSIVTRGSNGATAIAAHVFAAGSENNNARRRAALLQPADSFAIGSGDVPNPVFNAFTIPATTLSSFAAGTWPAAGYVPHQLMPGRWSIFFSDQTNTSSVGVTVTRDDGVPVNVLIIERGVLSVTWTLDGSAEGGQFAPTFRGESGAWNAYVPKRDVKYHVRITGIRDTSAALYHGNGELSYDVIGFDPDAPAVGTDTSSSRLLDIATRGDILGGDDAMIAGFVISGDMPKTVLIRAAGPGLSRFLSNYCSDPSLELHHGSPIIATNDNWGDSQGAPIAVASRLVGADPWTPGSKDSAILTTLAPGAYSAIVHGVGGSTGVGLVEVFEINDASQIPGYSPDAIPTDAHSRLYNIATRGKIGTGDSVMIAGIVITGTKTKTVLVRAGGPALARYLSTFCVDPELEVHHGSAVIASNMNWCDTQEAEITSVAAAVGAGAWEHGSRDAALVLTVDPGIYSVVIRGTGGSTGVALVEVFEVN